MMVVSLLCVGNTLSFAGVRLETLVVPDSISAQQQNRKSQVEDFITFEKRFVSDENFQISRIIFDDLGYKPDDAPEAEAVKWSRENWNFHKATLDEVKKGGQFKTNRTLTTDKCVQAIWLENTSFLLEYTYTCIDGKWYLTKVFERI